MSYVADDLAAAFADLAATVPVRYQGTTVRGLLDRGVAVDQVQNLNVEHGVDVLHVARGALPALALDDTLQIGDVGAAAVADTDPTFCFRGFVAFRDDGQLRHLALVEVPA